MQVPRAVIIQALLSFRLLLFWSQVHSQKRTGTAPFKLIETSPLNVVAQSTRSTFLVSIEHAQ